MSSFMASRVEVELTVHLAKSVLNAQSRKSAIGMRGHDPNDTASLGIESSRDNPQNDILARKDSRNLFTIVLHDADGSRPLLPHQFRSLSNGCLETDRSCRSTSIEDRTEVGERHLVSKGLDVSEERVRGSFGASELLLGTFEGSVEFLRGTIRLFELLERLVEDFRDIE